MNKAVFLDRDGVINRKAAPGGYITAWESFEFLPEVVEAVALINEAGFQAIVVTNQRCVAKGLITPRQLDAIHERMCKELARLGATIEAVYYCPHEIEAGCACRKPAPGLLLSAARDCDIDLAQSWMIGDSEIDAAAGKAAGCSTVRLTNGESDATDADLTATSLLAAIQQILKFETVAA